MNIGIFTSSRSDYGILKNIIKLFNNSKDFKLKLFVAGSHLSNIFGSTISEIKKDNINNIIKCPNIIVKKGEIDISESYLNLSKVFLKNIKKKKNTIDLMVLLGDRYELLPIANTCLLKGIKIAHLHGGETTEGVIDNYVRKIVSISSNYHFVSTNKSKFNLLKHGIKNKNIVVIGAPALENINKNLYTKEKLEKKFNFSFYKKNIIVSYHPETMNKNNIEKNLKILLESIQYFKHIRFIFSAPGADTKGSLIKKKILKFVIKNKNTVYFDSFGHIEYLSFLKFCDLIIGNSSSGIIEAPSVKTMSIDLGQRQKGRERSKSIIKSNFKKKNIIHLIKKYLKNKKKINFTNPYLISKYPSKKFYNIIKKIYKI